MKNAMLQTAGGGLRAPTRSGGFDGASQRFIYSRLPAGTHCLVAGDNIGVYAEGDRLLDRRFLRSTLSSR